jgi:hypothetical protein
MGAVITLYLNRKPARRRVLCQTSCADSRSFKSFSTSRALGLIVFPLCLLDRPYWRERRGWLCIAYHRESDLAAAIFLPCFVG